MSLVTSAHLLQTTVPTESHGDGSPTVDNVKFLSRESVTDFKPRDPSPIPPPVPDSGFWALAAVAHFYRIAAQPEKLAHELGRTRIKLQYRRHRSWCAKTWP